MAKIGTKNDDLHKIIQRPKNRICNGRVCVCEREREEGSESMCVCACKKGVCFLERERER